MNPQLLAKPLEKFKAALRAFSLWAAAALWLLLDAWAHEKAWTEIRTPVLLVLLGGGLFEGLRFFMPQSRRDRDQRSEVQVEPNPLPCRATQGFAFALMMILLIVIAFAVETLWRQAGDRGLGALALALSIHLIFGGTYLAISQGLWAIYEARGQSDTS